MKIEKLDLAAFGPFRHARLDFGQNPDALQVIYGRNEAGKSTTLRAITQLLYGIPHQSGDAYRHEPNKLRIGATLLDVDGTRLRVVRRKGRVNTLLDAEGEPLDEGLLVRLLGGTPQALFESMFGLDHTSLRAGAEALLAGNGDLGEGLFDAGVGGIPVHRVLDELRNEAEALYKPRGKTPLLNTALARAKELGEQRRGAALAPEKWQEQKRALEKAEQTYRERSEQRAALEAERGRLERALKVLPKLRELDRHVSEREALGEVPNLAADAAERRLQAEQGLLASERELARTNDELTHLRERLDALGEAPADPLGEQVTQQLREQFGSYRKAAQERPERQAERRELEASLAGLTAALPAGVAERVGPDYRPPADLEARLAQLSKQGQDAAAELNRRSDEAQERAQEIARLKSELEGLGPARDLRALSALLDDPRAQTDVTALRQGMAEVAAELSRVERGLSELGLPFGPEALCTQPLPAAAQLARLREQAQALDTRRAQLAERQRELDAVLLDVRAQHNLLTARGEVPSEAALRTARRARDEAFEEVAEALRGERPVPVETLEGLQPLLEQADLLADRMWREADRVQRAAELTERRERAMEQAQALLGEIEGWEQEHAAFGTQLEALAEPLGLAALDAIELERRVETARQLQRETERALRQRAGLAERERAAGELSEELARALAALESETSGDDAPARGAEQLGQWLARARQALESARQRDAQALATRQAIEVAERALTQATHWRAKAEESRHAQAASWRDEALALGLSGEASEEEVLSCVRVLHQRAQQRAELVRLDARLSALDAEMHAHEREVRTLCEKHLGGFVPESAAEGVDRLDRHCQAERDRARDRAHFQEALDKQLAQARSAQAQRQTCSQELAALCARARVDDASALPEAERRATEAQRLDARVAELRRELSEVGEGESTEALRSLTRDVVPEQARARLAELEDEITQLREELDDAKEDMGRYRAGLELYEEGAGAAELAERQEGQLSEVLELSHQYLVRRMAERLLRGEVERYREANQGPLLRRASELIGPLTLGRYLRLREEFEQDDQPRLCMVRADDDQPVEVAALSDGTRDALYLALRLSSIERFVQHNAPIPLVLDDCFIHFDDERARAALGVLGGQAKSSQVLLFTHHQRIVELAREALGKGGVVTHDLDEARRLGEGRNDGPLFATR